LSPGKAKYISSIYRTQHFNGHFPGKPGLASCPLESQSPIILIQSSQVSSWDRTKLHPFLLK